MDVPGISDLELLGSSDSGTTYIGVDADSGERVAVRVMRAGMASNEDHFSYLVQAKGHIAKIAGATPIHATGVLPSGELYLVRPSYETSLHASLASGALTEQNAAHIMGKVSRAMAQAHNQGVIHGDIKPANILMDSPDDVVISDFGILEFLASSASLSGAMLTPPFAPPERFQEAPPHPSADVYSIGATLFALLVGRPPFKTMGNNGAAAERHRIISNQVPIDDLPATTSQELRELILDCMAKLPANRPSATEVADRLANLPEPSTRPPPTPAPSATPPQPQPQSQSQSQPQTKAASGSGSGRKISNRKTILRFGAFGVLVAILMVTRAGSGDSTPNLALSADSEAPGQAQAEGRALRSSGSLWEAVVRSNRESFIALGEGTVLAAELNTDFEETAVVDLHTVFAFRSATIQAAELAEVTNDQQLREATFSYHVVPNALTFADLLALDGQDLTTHSGQPIAVDVVSGQVMLNGTARVLNPVTTADNGIIYPIDELLEPPSA